MERKLTAILCADVHGYSRLMGQDEEWTLRTLSSYRKIIDGIIEQHKGRFVNSAGDSVLAEFASIVSAVQCGVDIQNALRAENARLLPDSRMEFRIGINLGDVMVEGEEIYGDGVNVAARLESLAEPGGICISETVYEQVSNKLTLNFEDLGEQSVKNIAKPVRVLRVLAEPRATVPLTSTEKPPAPVPNRLFKVGAWSAAGIVIVVGAIVIVQHLSLRQPSTSASIPPVQLKTHPMPKQPSIAVLPFVNQSGDSGQEYFSDGITDSLTTALARMPDLFVIARTSTFPYKDKDTDLQKLGQELGVRYLLEGSVRREGERIQVTARLVDSATGAEVWSQSYDKALGEIFSVQDNIVQRVVTSINPKLATSDKGATPSTSSGTNNVEAYDYYLQGLEYSLSYQTKEANQKARELLEKAIALDSKYADAYALLGWVYIRDLVNQWDPDPQGWDKASQLEQQAIALDPSNAAAYGAMSQLYLLNKQYDQSIAAAQHAVDLEPNAAITHAWLALALAYSGKQEEAIAALKQASRLDPMWEDSYLLGEGGAYNAMGRYEDAVPLLKRYIASFPDDLIAHANLAIAYIELGRQADAQAEAAEVLRIDPQFTLIDPKDTALEDVALAQRYNTDLRKAGLK